jgi:hypothetical protein
MACGAEAWFVELGFQLDGLDGEIPADCSNAIAVNFTNPYATQGGVCAQISSISEDPNGGQIFDAFHVFFSKGIYIALSISTLCFLTFYVSRKRTYGDTYYENRECAARNIVISWKSSDSLTEMVLSTFEPINLC